MFLGPGVQRSTHFPYQNNDPSRRNMGRGVRGRMNLRPGHENERFIKFVGFRTLEEIAKADKQDVLQKLNDKREGFMQVINSPIDRHDVFVLVIGILSKIVQTPFVGLKSKLILDVCNSNFISHLRNYLMDLPYVENKTKNNLYWNDQSEFWKNFIIFCGDIVETSPSTARKTCRALIESISKTCLEYLNQRHAFVLSEEYVVKLNEIRDKLTELGDKEQVSNSKCIMYLFHFKI